MLAGVYAIRNLLSGECYVGSSQDIEQRWALHRSQLRLNKHHSRYLQRSWNKHGPDRFEWLVLEEVSDLSQILDREQHYIDTLKPVYNGAPTAYRMTGFVFPPESREKIRQALKGRKQDPAVVERIAAQLRGRPQSPESNEKRRARWNDPAYREHQRQKRLGKSPDQATRDKIRAAHLGRKQTPEHIEKHRQAVTGKKRSQSAIEAQRQKLLGRKQSPETAEKKRRAMAAFLERKRAEQLAQ